MTRWGIKYEKLEVISIVPAHCVALKKHLSSIRWSVATNPSGIHLKLSTKMDIDVHQCSRRSRWHQAYAEVFSKSYEIPLKESQKREVAKF
jgi:hypothetical protein